MFYICLHALFSPLNFNTGSYDRQRNVQRKKWSMENIAVPKRGEKNKKRFEKIAGDGVKILVLMHLGP